MVLFGFGVDGVWLASFDTGTNLMSGDGCGVSRCSGVFLCFSLDKVVVVVVRRCRSLFRCGCSSGLRFCSSPVLNGNGFEVGGGGWWWLTDLRWVVVVDGSETGVVAAAVMGLL